MLLSDFEPFPRLVIHNTKTTRFNLKTQVGKNSKSIKINIHETCQTHLGCWLSTQVLSCCPTTRVVGLSRWNHLENVYGYIIAKETNHYYHQGEGVAMRILGDHVVFRKNGGWSVWGEDCRKLTANQLRMPMKGEITTIFSRALRVCLCGKGQRRGLNTINRDTTELFPAPPPPRDKKRPFLNSLMVSYSLNPVCKNRFQFHRHF